jgi:hypothetical protein
VCFGIASERAYTDKQSLGHGSIKCQGSGDWIGVPIARCTESPACGDHRRTSATLCASRSTDKLKHYRESQTSSAAITNSLTVTKFSIKALRPMTIQTMIADKKSCHHSLNAGKTGVDTAQSQFLSKINHDNRSPSPIPCALAILDGFLQTGNVCTKMNIVKP